MTDTGLGLAVAIIGGLSMGCLYLLYLIHLKLSELVEILKPEEEGDEND